MVTVLVTDVAGFPLSVNVTTGNGVNAMPTAWDSEGLVVKLSA
jgi:hypothetical protein